jgi:4-hydroxy-4-methyl-2-oxoglutarate aldolase
VSGVVVRSGPSPNADAVKILGQVGVSTTHESQHRTGLLAPYLRPIYPGRRIAGRAVTVLTRPGDNLMIHAAIEQLRPGDVLVVATTSPTTDGAVGELIATSARAHGAIGMVLDTGVRDVAALTAMDFPVWSRAVSAQGTVKASAGSVNVPVVVAGALVAPGDVVVADDDGVAVVPRATASEVARRAAEREAAEDAKRETLAGGALALDLYDLRPLLERLGVAYRDAEH